MFIKKDLRKIPQIFAEASKADDEELTELRLSRRPAEFNGSISALIQPSYAPSLDKLTSLSLYECQISNLDGVEFFAESCPNLEKMNLGRNPLSSLPDNLGSIQSLTGIWLDDCEIEGQMPVCLSRLKNLELLRMSNNRITGLTGDDVKGWEEMKVLCLDGNLIPRVPQEMANLKKLKMLSLRNNKLKSLPEGVPGVSHEHLTLFHVSSNELTALPASLSECPSLATIYANANKIEILPQGLAHMKSLASCNLSNNFIATLGDDFLERFGEPSENDGKCAKDENCCIQLDQNPVVKIKDKSQDENAMHVC